MSLGTMPRRLRLMVFAALGAGILAAAASDFSWESDKVVEPVRGKGSAHAASAAKQSTGKSRLPELARVELERLDAGGEASASAEAEVENPFAAISWYVPPPPPPPPPPAPPPKPTAPPLPFTYLGRYQDTATLVLILSKGDRVYTVSPGEVIEGTYRVERAVGRSVELTYLPLHITQMLAAGDA